MVFMLELDGETVACSSARCVHTLLRQGWRFTDPSQADTLQLELRRERPLPSSTLAQPRSRAH
jgi:beta-glucosidase-like glycosyl hydrolase